VLFCRGRSSRACAGGRIAAMIAKLSRPAGKGEFTSIDTADDGREIRCSSPGRMRDFRRRRRAALDRRDLRRAALPFRGLLDMLGVKARFSPEAITSRRPKIFRRNRSREGRPNEMTKMAGSIVFPGRRSTHCQRGRKKTFRSRRQGLDRHGLYTAGKNGEGEGGGLNRRSSEHRQDFTACSRGKMMA